MGLFDEQIEERRRSDQQLLEDSFVSISEILLGERGSARFLQSRLIARNALDEILKFYHLRPVELPQEIPCGSISAPRA